MNISPDSALWKVARLVQQDLNWIDLFDTGNAMSHHQRDALVDLIWDAIDPALANYDREITSTEIQSAIRKLVTLFDGPYRALAVDTIQRAMDLRWAEPRQLGIEVLSDAIEARPRIFHHLQNDPSWMVRRAAVHAVGRWEKVDSTTLDWRAIFAAADDPHWRVRLAVVELAEQLAMRESWTTVIEVALQSWEQANISHAAIYRARRLGVWQQMHSLADLPTGPVPPCLVHSPISPMVNGEPLIPPQSWFVDPDPLVIAWKLKSNLRTLDRQLDLWSVHWLGSDYDALADEACRRLELCNDQEIFAALAFWLEDPRHPGFTHLQKLMKHLDEDRLNWIQASANNSAVNPLKNPSSTMTVIDEAGFVRNRYSEELNIAFGNTHPRVRCTTMNRQRAEELFSDPEQESSWSVLRSAAAILNRPLPNGPSKPPKVVMPLNELVCNFGSAPYARVVLPGQPAVAPLGLSGHYHLPESGFQLAVEHGVELMFFEPNYATMRRFMLSLPVSQRNRIQLVSGTFEAEPKRIAADVDRILKLLNRESIDLFLMFWVRDWSRISDEAVSELSKLQTSGKIKAHSLSTHNLALASEAIQRNYSPIMVRHNAAHRSVETEVMPMAKTLGTPLILFNSTCYGRLLGRDPKTGIEILAADCYRFSLEQQSACACWTAPSTVEQLQANLKVLETIEIDEVRRGLLVERGNNIRRSDKSVAQNLRFVS